MDNEKQSLPKRIATKKVKLLIKKERESLFQKLVKLYPAVCKEEQEAIDKASALIKRLSENRS